MSDYFYNDLEENLDYLNLTDHDIVFLKDICSALSYDNIYSGLDFLCKYRSVEFFDFISTVDDIYGKMVLSFFNKIIEIDINSLTFGEMKDEYNLHENVVKGSEMSLPEIIYENNYILLTPINNNFNKIDDIVSKNGTVKSIINLHNCAEIYLYKSLTDERELNNYFNAINMGTGAKFEIENWMSFLFETRKKILNDIYYNSGKLRAFAFNEIGKLGRRNKVEKVSGYKSSVYEYRMAIDNGTFRFYFVKEKELLKFILGIQKKTETIDNRLSNKIKSKL